MKKLKNLKVLGIIVTGVGLVLNFVSNVIDARVQEDTIAEKVSEAVAKLTSNKTEG